MTPEAVRLANELKVAEQEILYTKERISTINKEMATAEGARRQELERLKGIEEQTLRNKEQALAVDKQVYQTEKAKTDAAKDTAEALKEQVTQKSLASKLSDDIGKQYDKMVYKSQRLVSLAGENEEAVRAVADFNKGLVTIDQTRSQLIEAIRQGDTEEASRLSGIVTDKQKELQASITQLPISDQMKLLMAEQLEISNKINQEAAARATLTEEEAAALKKLTGEAEEMKNRFLGVKNMIIAALKSPATLIGLSVKGVGVLADKFGEVNKELGRGITEIDSFSANTVLLGFFFKDAAATSKQLATNMGNLKAVSGEVQRGVSMLANNLGVSGPVLANVTNQFGNLSGKSNETALNMIKTVENTAKLRGVIPGDVMEDIAQDAEGFAKYSKNGGANMAAAAIQARQLGVTLATTNKLADTLLDFESSIEKELELNAMLGREINLQKARELFYAGESEKAMDEVIRQLGTQAEFNKMDKFQKEAAAQTLGLTVDELSKMYANQENIGKSSGLIKSTYDGMTEAIKAAGNEWAGGILGGLGNGIILLGQFGMGVNSLKGGFSAVSGMIGKMFSKGSPGSDAASKAAENLTGGGGKKPEIPDTKSMESGKGVTDSASKINMSSVLKGALAMVLIAGALYILAKALQEMKDVGLNEIGMAAAGIVLLTGSVIALGALVSGTGPLLLYAAAAMILVSASLYVLGKALQEISQVAGVDFTSIGSQLVKFSADMALIGLMSPAILFGSLALATLGLTLPIFAMGLALTGSALSSVAGIINPITEMLSMISQIDFMPIFGLAGALTTLAMALALVGTMGVLALPVLAGLNTLAQGGILNVFGGGGEGGESSKTDELLSEIRGLRSDLLAGKIAVYMDGENVTAAIAGVNSSNPVRD